MYDKTDEMQFSQVEHLLWEQGVVGSNPAISTKQKEINGTDICWCPDCVGGETLTMVNQVCSKHGQLYIKGEHKNG